MDTRRTLFWFTVALAAGCCVSAAVRLSLQRFAPTEPAAPTTQPRAANDAAAAIGLLSAHRGQVLVLLLGREDCPGTARATKVLDDYKPPAGVAVVRVEVPLPGEDLKPPAAWQHPFPVALDTDRKLAAKLDFFYYPTLYVFDRDGEQRFAGGCDAQALPDMVAEIAGEKPGAQKKMYSLAQPAPGTAAPAFSGKSLDGKDVTLESLRGKRATLLFFGSTTCPFSIKELPQLATLADEYKKRDVAVAIVNRGGEKEKLAALYEKSAPGLLVVWDQDLAISNAYGVDAVPFFFLLDGAGKIVKRRSYTATAAAGALNAYLGIATEKPRYKPAAAG